MAVITVTVPDEAKAKFDERARTLKSRTGGNFKDGAELLFEVVEGHLVAAEQEKQQQTADKEYRKRERAVHRMMRPDEED